MGQQRHVGEMDTESVEAAIAEEMKMTKKVNKMNAVMKKAPKTTCIGERKPLAPKYGAWWFIALRNRAARARGSGGVDEFLWMHRFFAGGLGTEKGRTLKISVSAILEVVWTEWHRWRDRSS